MASRIESLPTEPRNDGVVAFIPFDNRCSREVAEAIARVAAATMGVGVDILASETPEDWALLQPYICGPDTDKPQSADTRATVATITPVVAIDATIVLRARHSNGPNAYEQLAEGLEYVERAVAEQTARVN